jgi:hypothetical protein
MPNNLIPARQTGVAPRGSREIEITRPTMKALAQLEQHEVAQKLWTRF